MQCPPVLAPSLITDSTGKGATASVHGPKTPGTPLPTLRFPQLIGTIWICRPAWGQRPAMHPKDAATGISP
jgi:hypothetical protein